MKISNYELALFFKQLAMTYQASIGLDSGIAVICEELENKAFKEELLAIKAKISIDYSFYNALLESDYFDKYSCELIKIGENTGYLDIILASLSDYYFHLDKLQHRLKETLTYPLLLFAVMLMIMLLLILKILPIFKQVLNSLGTDISYSAYIIFNFTSLLVQYGLYIFLIILIILLAYWIYMAKKANENYFVYWFNHSIITKNLSKNYAISKYLSGMDLLLKSGFYDKISLLNLQELLNNPLIKVKAKQIANDSDDKNLAQAIMASDLLTKSYNKMLAIAFKTGRLAEMVHFISQEYDKNVDQAINRFINRIEPVLIIICVVIVTIILLAILMPLLSVMVSL